MDKSLRNSRHAYLALFLIMLFGGWLRLGASLHTEVDSPLRADAGQYYTYAYNLHAFHVYSHELKLGPPGQVAAPAPDALRTPGYPLFLALVAGGIPDGSTILRIVLLQAILGILTIPLTYFIAHRIVPGPWPLLPALLTAMSPQLVVSGTYVLSEALFTVLLLASIATMIEQFRQPQRPGFAILGGILVGVAALTRPTLLYLLPVVLAGMLPLMPIGTRAKQIGAMTAGFALAYAPWLVRNLLTLHLSSDPTLMISSLVHGHYPDLMYQGRPETLGYPYRFDPRIGDISASTSTALAEIWRCFVAEPATYLRWYLVGKPLAFLGWGDAAAANDIFTYPTLHSPYFTNPVFQATKALMRLTHWIWVGLAFATVAMSFMQRKITGSANAGHERAPRLLGLVAVYFVAVHVAGFPIARYCVPFLPILFVLAAGTMAACIPAWHPTFKLRSAGELLD